MLQVAPQAPKLWNLRNDLEMMMMMMMMMKEEEVVVVVEEEEEEKPGRGR